MSPARHAALALLLPLAGCFGDPRTGVSAGGQCDASSDCQTGLVCAADATCHAPGEPGTADVGDACVTTVQCQLDLACAADGTCQVQGAHGTAAFGDTCRVDDDCQAGLSCPDGTCRGLQMGLWAGAECTPPSEEAGPFRVYFEVPRGEPLADFYRLPFPNDVRVDPFDQIDLSGHPTPGALVDVVGDVVGNLTRVVSTELGGRFGTNQAIFFRLTAFPDSRTLSFGLPGVGTMALVDLDDHGASTPIAYVANSGRTPYLCENWLAMYPIDGHPLEGGHTYAALLARGIHDDQGAEAAQDADFTALVAASEPSDPALLPAWRKYAKLRAWLADADIDPSTLAAAAVFTTADPTSTPRLVRDAVLAQPTPTLEGLIVCGTGDDPYAVSGDDSRGCTPPDDRWHELQATVALPQFQEGAPPYKDATDGGGIAIRAGKASVDHTDDVHVALAVPKGVTMPEAGWPVILYAHGTGGSYTTHLRGGFDDAFARVTLDDDTVVSFAVVGFDAPLHGPRARPDAWKASWLDVDPHAYDPDVLFFNPLNPRAARDNAVQEAADLWSLVRLLASVDLDAESSPTGEPVRFDLDHLVFAGHSQGATVGPMFAAWEPRVEAVVLSGAGALTIRSLLDKTSPNPLLPALRVALADPSVSRAHPILNLVQQLGESADGVNHARAVLRRPPEGSTGKHVLQIYGVGDTYSPDSTQSALAKALGLPQATNGQAPIKDVDVVTLPASGGSVGGRTGLVSLFPAPAGIDAHFVIDEDETAQRQVATFLGTLVRDGTPTVP